jgi:hypothetical protein
MSSQDDTPAQDVLPFRDTAQAVRPYLPGRRGLLVLAAIVLVAGLALNWSWLVAAGIAPILVALAPCAAMCAAGYCMSRMTGQSRSAETMSRQPAEPVADRVTSIADDAVVADAPIRTSQFQEDERRDTDAQISHIPSPRRRARPGVDHSAPSLRPGGTSPEPLDDGAGHDGRTRHDGRDEHGADEPNDGPLQPDDGQGARVRQAQRAVAAADAKDA